MVDANTFNRNKFLRVAVKQLTAQAVQRLSKDLSDVTVQFFDVMEKNLDRRRQRDAFRQANRNLAEGAKSAVVKSYDNLIGNRPHPSYRGGDRLSGRMSTALKSGGWIRGTESGINYIDRDFLDGEAAHWHRLAFGAAPSGVPVVSTMEVFFGSDSARVTAFSASPSGPFTLPKGGTFIDPKSGKTVPLGGRGDEFHLGVPESRHALSKTIPTSGIVGRNFFQAGLDYIGENVEKEYTPIIERAIDLAARDLGVLADR
jgi:hypothetical protein